MNRSKKILNRQGGFTLIEMLIVVAIIAILVAVSIPMVTKNLDKTKDATDAANLRSAKAAAVLDYMEDSSIVGSYYDLDEGKLTTEPQSGQGQSESKKGMHISIEVSSDEVKAVWASDS